MKSSKPTQAGARKIGSEEKSHHVSLSSAAVKLLHGEFGQLLTTAGLEESLQYAITSIIRRWILSHMAGMTQLPARAH